MVHSSQGQRRNRLTDGGRDSNLLNTHDGASLYETFRPEETRRILDKMDFH